MTKPKATARQQDKPPVHPFEVTIHIGANNWEYVAHTLEKLADRAVSKQPDALGLMSGGYDGSHSVTVTQRNVTPEQYRSELATWCGN